MAALPGLTTLQATLTIQMGYTATLAAGGGATAVASSSNSTTVKKNVTGSTSIANASAGGADEMYITMTAVTASSSVSIDFTSVSDVMGQAAGSFARLKSIMAQLLSTGDDSVNGTAAASATIDNTVANALSAQSHSGWFDNANEGAAGGSKFTIKNGDVMAWGTTAAGGLVVDGTHKIVKWTNNDGALTANILMSAFGGHS